LSKTQPKEQSNSGTVADQVAEFIGRTMGELLNRKDALSKQMADVDNQIADIRNRVVSQFGGMVPSATRRGKRSQKAGSKRVRAAKAGSREVTEETRLKMAEAARRRWARERSKKR
jgi:hypothetical protein